MTIRIENQDRPVAVTADSDNTRVDTNAAMIAMMSVLMSLMNLIMSTYSDSMAGNASMSSVTQKIQRAQADQMLAKLKKMAKESAKALKMNKIGRALGFAFGALAVAASAFMGPAVLAVSIGLFALTTPFKDESVLDMAATKLAKAFGGGAGGKIGAKIFLIIAIIAAVAASKGAATSLAAKTTATEGAAMSAGAILRSAPVVLAGVQSNLALNPLQDILGEALRNCKDKDKAEIAAVVVSMIVNLALGLVAMKFSIKDATPGFMNKAYMVQLSKATNAATGVTGLSKAGVDGYTGYEGYEISQIIRSLGDVKSSMQMTESMHEASVQRQKTTSTSYKAEVSELGESTADSSTWLEGAFAEARALAQNA